MIPMGEEGHRTKSENHTKQQTIECYDAKRK